MTQEVRHIPPAQRHARWRTVLWYRWPLGLIGLTMAIYGSLVALMLFYASAGRQQMDRALDTEPSLETSATVTVVQSTKMVRPDGTPVEHVRYEFEAPSPRSARTGKHLGWSYVDAGTCRESEAVPVRYNIEHPDKNRVVGTRLSTRSDLTSPILGFVVLPGILLVLLWVQGLFDLRRLLASGDVAMAVPVRVDQVAWIVPVMLRTRYRFRDHHAQWCEGSHWVPVNSALGEMLTSGAARLAVVHDRARPDRNRLVVAADFAGDGDARSVPAAARRA